MPPRARIVALLCCLTATEAHADLTAEVAVLSDYRFRGVSLSDGQPSLQANLDWSGSAGLFAGVLASTVRLGRTDPVSGIGAQGYIGYAGPLSSHSAWSGGLAVYWFPATRRGSIDYQELFLRIGSERWLAGLYVSHDYYGSGAASAYATLSASQPIGDTLTLFASAGWLTTGRPDGRGAANHRTQRFDARLGLALEMGFATAEVSVAGATTDNDVCRADRDACAPAVVVALRKTF